MNVKNLLLFCITIINAYCFSQTIIDKDINLGQSVILCPNTIGLSGSLQVRNLNCSTLSHVEINSLSSSSACLSVTGNSIGSGDVICIEVCNELNTLCKTTEFRIKVIPSNECSDFLNDKIYIKSNNCEPVSVCIPLPLEEVFDNDIFVNGQIYSQSISGCNFIYTLNYSYGQLPNDGASGPYKVVSWIVNGQVFSGDFNTMPDLIDSLNTWDHNGNWELLSDQLLISGGNPQDNSYSAIEILHYFTNFKVSLGKNTGETAFGTVLLLEPGKNTIEIAHKSNACIDIGEIHVVCFPNADFVDTIYTNSTINYCVDLSIFNGNTFTLEDPCSSFVNWGTFELSSPACVQYNAGSVAGKDTSCLVVCDNLGLCDTSTWVIVVVPRPDTLRDSIDVGISHQICFDVSELQSNLNLVYENCEPLELANLVLQNGQNCFSVVGSATGVDTSCIVICDDLGFCDTTFYLLSINAAAPPNLVSDYDTLQVNQNAQINILNNDTLRGANTIEVIRPFAYGSSSLSLNGDLNYTPLENFCRPDSLQYRACNEIGCDTATVYMIVYCEDIMIFSGFSPNGDNINDYFTIYGIENFPNNHLQIYNIWGNLLYDVKGYKNEWDGNWGNYILTNGTYYYILEIYDTNKSYKGFIQLRR